MLSIPQTGLRSRASSKHVRISDSTSSTRSVTSEAIFHLGLFNLLRIGEAIFVVDRLIRRKGGSTRSWDRDLRVRIEVLDPSFWQSPEILLALKRAAEFVSGDFWDFEFFGGRSCYEWAKPLLSNLYFGESPLVCLYSGGLDSAAGLGLRMQETLGRPILPVTIHHQPLQERLVKKQYQLLDHCFGPRISPLVIKVWMNRPAGWTWRQREKSQRARSFLFAAAGAVAATMTGQNHVEVFESGIGAINVPLMSGMVGSMATRGSHPEFLSRMSRLASLVAGCEINFRLPFIGWTKGEMVRALNEVGLGELARATVSCARYPLGYHTYEQCGICAACVFRRQAIQFAGIEEGTGCYSFDLFGPVGQVNSVPSEKLDYLKAFLMQVANWSDIELTGNLPESTERHLLDTRVLKPGDSREEVIRLLARYRDEWEQIAAEGRERGYEWAEMLAPIQVPVSPGANHAFG